MHSNAINMVCFVSASKKEDQIKKGPFPSKALLVSEACLANECAITFASLLGLVADFHSNYH